MDTTTDTDRIATRSDQLFRDRYDANLRRTDRMFAALMLGQWAFAIVIALVLSPYAWQGRARELHYHVWTAIFLGGLLTLFPVALVVLRPGAVLTRHCIAVAQMLWSALLIHLTGGRIETHFHVFGSLAFLSFYRDWRVLLPATIVVAADHLLRQIFWPESVYGIVAPEAWRFLEHAFWVAFEDVFLVLACVAGVREMRSIAAQQAKIESTEQLQKEMEIATQIQTAILPRDPSVEGLEIAARMIPASEVGGDYYDVLPVDDGCWIGIGDVSGHGLAAGLFMLQAQSAVKALVLQNPNRAPKDLFSDLNRAIYGNVHERLGAVDHMTMSLLRYREGGSVVMVGAHTDAIIFRKKTGRCERIAACGTWIGLVEDVRAATKEVELQLDTGDVLVLYSDGLTEAMNAGEEQFGLDRVCAEIEAARSAGPKDIRDRLLAAVAAWQPKQADDVTIMVIHQQAALENANAAVA